MTSKTTALASPRRLAGFALVFAGVVLIGLQAWQHLEVSLSDEAVRALQGGLLCALATALGAFPVLITRSIPVRIADGMLGFGAGVMLAATAFSLVVPGLAAAGDLGYSKWGAGAIVSTGVILGVLAMLWLDHAWPHAHFDSDGQTTRGQAWSSHSIASTPRITPVLTMAPAPHFE